jgi:hypothetical protein
LLIAGMAEGVQAVPSHFPTSRITGSPALLMIGSPDSSVTGTSVTMPAAIWMGADPRSNWHMI